MKSKWHKDNTPHPDESRHDEANREWYKKRNKEVLADKKVKSFKELTIKYGLSTTRLREIIDSNKFKGI